MSPARPDRSSLLARAWVRAAAAPLAAAALAAVVAPALLGEGAPPVAAPPPARVVAEAPPPAPPPPDRPPAPPRAPVSGLPDLALRWRLAVIEGQRQQVMTLTTALRGHAEAAALLARLAADPHARVRAYAVRELGRRRDPAQRDLLLAARGDPSPHVRDNADWALSQLEVP